MQEYDKVQDEVQSELGNFQSNLLRYREPDSVQVLREKSDIEV